MSRSTMTGPEVHRFATEEQAQDAWASWREHDIPVRYWPTARYRVHYGWDRRDDYATLGEAFARVRELMASPVNDSALQAVQVRDMLSTKPYLYLYTGDRKLVTRRAMARATDWRVY